VTEAKAVEPEPLQQTMEAPVTAEVMETPAAAMETPAEVAENPTPAIEALAATMQAPAEAMALPDNPEPVAQALEITDEVAAEAHDEAVLDLIAAEMSAPDPIEDDMFEAVAEAAPGVEPAPIAPTIFAETPEPAVASIAPEVSIAPSPVVEPAPESVAREPAHEVSLGSSIIASGMLKRPSLPANDPLAPIRRMSQAERIAFFS
jgi:hypothetical protein